MHVSSSLHSSLHEVRTGSPLQGAHRVYHYTGEGARAGCTAIQARARAQGVPLYRRGRARRVYRYTGEGARAGCTAIQARARAQGVLRYRRGRARRVYRYLQVRARAGLQ